MSKSMTRIEILKAYFGSPPNRPVDIKELKALSSVERAEMAQAAAKEMGVEIKEVTK